MTEPIQKKTWGASLEFMIQLGGLLVALTMSYMALDFRSKQTESTVRDVKQELSTFRDRVREVETQQVRLDERFTNIMTMLSRIDDRLQQTEARK
jgi:septal ring factor EnvC (AmiA/AmiB activator)